MLAAWICVSNDAGGAKTPRKRAYGSAPSIAPAPTGDLPNSGLTSAAAAANAGAADDDVSLTPFYAQTSWPALHRDSGNSDFVPYVAPLAISRTTGRLFITAAGAERTKGVLYGLDLVNGAWSIAFAAAIGAGSGTSPSISQDGRQVYAVGGDHVMVAIDAETGDPLWRVADSDAAAAPAVGPDGTIYTVIGGQWQVRRFGPRPFLCKPWSAENRRIFRPGHTGRSTGSMELQLHSCPSTIKVSRVADCNFSTAGDRRVHDKSGGIGVDRSPGQKWRDVALCDRHRGRAYFARRSGLAGGARSRKTGVSPIIPLLQGRRTR